MTEGVVRWSCRAARAAVQGSTLALLVPTIHALARLAGAVDRADRRVRDLTGGAR